jgi:dipeptidyl aminopeptidase/acylaminoacyl peptidase
MPTTIPTARADFRSRDTRCAGWLTLPPGPGPHPAIVLVHGLGATHDMMLGQYEQHFAAAGIATMAFDYRNTGASAANRGNIFRPERSGTTWQRRWHISRRGPRSTPRASGSGAPASEA